jgi:ornithine carbamoyltransferase/carbamoyltransferase
VNTLDGRRTAGAPGFLSLSDLPGGALARLAERACELYRDPLAHSRPLADRSIGVLFTKPSTRTRTAFTVATIRLGGHPVAYGPADLQTNTGESLADTARILGLMLDGLVVRTAGPLADMRQLARESGIPVVNAMASEEHPTQGVCDVATLRLHLGRDAGIRLLYVGEGNNTAAALAHAMAQLPDGRLTLLTPPGYGLPPDALDAAMRSGATARVRQVHTLDALPDEVDAVYTTRWQTTGSTKHDPGWREAFRDYYIDDAFMDRWPRALFMHDLPAHRGDEVAGSVLDGPRSIAWSQAQMKLASAMAVLEHVHR